jgi:hypothetical protein
LSSACSRSGPEFLSAGSIGRKYYPGNIDVTRLVCYRLVTLTGEAIPVTSDRKAATAAYKERKTFAGIFVIRCTASPQAWVGQTPNLEKIQNRIWFTLRQGSHTCRTLQAAWTAHGPDSLTFRECERLEEEATPYIRDALLKERALHWRSQFGAEAV